MGEAANVAINDGADTPVSVTFKPEQVSGGNATFRDDRQGISVLMPRIKSVTSLSSAARPTTRVSFAVAMPVKKTVDGADQVDYVLRAECQFVLPERCTAQNRKDLLAFVLNGLNASPFKETVVDVSPIWG
uniref:Coat protein n=1 Tax=Leviviridae sp. TaxID=2027243 RepID=A0A514D2R6_9VIRU|nr:MAG: hypothetical protein H2RhizoLitter493616_000003 [Leviviridae sp.]